MNLQEIKTVKVEMIGDKFNAILKSDNKEVNVSFEDLVPLRLENNKRFYSIVKTQQEQHLKDIEKIVEENPDMVDIKTVSFPKEWDTPPVSSNWTLFDMVEGSIGYVINTHYALITVVRAQKNKGDKI